MLQRIDISALQMAKTKDEVGIDISQYLVDPDIEVERPIPILSIRQGAENIALFTEDNISMLQGRAKSRKSTFLRAVVSAVVSGQYQMLYSGYERSGVAFVDTEQGSYHCYMAARSIKYLTGRAIPYYKTAGTTVEEKKYLVEQHLKENPDCGFMVLDNIVHFLRNFNDPAESAELNQWLIQVKSRYNVHICLVLHENSGEGGNGKAKGHLGSLLENTCETVIRIEKSTEDKGVSIVSARAMRGKEFEPFCVETDLQGNPQLSPFDGVMSKGRSGRQY